MGNVKSIMPTGAYDTVDGGPGPAGSSAAIPVARARGLSAMMQAGERPASTSTVIVLMLMLGGGVGGGAGWASAVFSGGASVEAVEKAQSEIRVELEALSGRLDATEKAQEDDRRAIRTQLAYQRWIVSALQSNAKALGAITKAQGLDIDVSLPALDLGDVLDRAP